MQVHVTVTILGACLLRGLKNDDGNDNTWQINDLIGWMRKYNRAARAALVLGEMFDVVCQTKTWKVHIWGSDDNASPQQ